MPRVFIQNFGCQMNDYDVERMFEVLRDEGYGRAETAEDADLVVLNSCAIREKSEHKVQSAAGRLRELKDARRDGGRPLTVAIGGCVAQQEGQRLLRRVPTADFTFGPDWRFAQLVIYEGDEPSYGWSGTETVSYSVTVSSCSNTPGSPPVTLQFPDTPIYLGSGTGSYTPGQTTLTGSMANVTWNFTRP